MINNKDFLDNINEIKSNVIDIKNWKNFKLKDLFEVKNNLQLNKDSFVFDNTNEYPYFTRTINNNGIAGYVDFIGDDYKIRGNCFAIGMMGIQFFYMKKDFYAGQFTKRIILKNKTLNENIAHFLTPLLNNFTETLKSSSVKNFANVFLDLKIPLPYLEKNDNFEPDWDYMEEYILMLKKELKIQEFYLVKNYINKRKIKSIESEKWSEFDFFYIFNKNEAKTGIVSPKKYKFKKNNTINYISAGTTNNACDAYIERELYLDNIHSKCLTIGTRGEYNGNMFYQEEEFVNSNTCMLLKYNKFNEMNDLTIKNISLFIAAVWNKNKKYGSYGIYPTLKSLNEDVIKLPSLINKNGEVEPDWIFINDYIINLEKEININLF